MSKLLSPVALCLYLCAISISVIFPYFHQGFFPTHDGEWAVVRLSDMYRELRDLQFPARYSGNLNFGYGYPLFNFAYPFPYYVGFLLHLIKFNFVDAIKLLFALTVPLSAVFMYLASSLLWRNKLAAFFSSLLYIFLPYRFVDLYVRGSIGESFSFVLYPLLFYSLLKFSETKKSQYGLLFSCSLAALLTSHNIMAVYFFPLLFGFLVVLFLSKKLQYIVPVLVFTTLGFGLSAFFWLPAIAEKQFIQLAKIPIADRNLYWVHPFQLLLPKIGYGTPTEKNGFSYQIGFGLLVTFILTIAAFFKTSLTKHKKNFHHFFNQIFSTLVIFYGFLLFSISGFFWQHVPLFSEINYPWTLLLPIGFLLSLLSGYLFSQVRYGKYVVIFLTISSIIIYFPYAKPQYYVNRGDGFYFTNDATTTSSSEYTPLWVKVKPSKRLDDKVISLSKKSSISNVVYSSKKITFSVNSSVADKIRINIIYYPGWHMFVDNKEVPITNNNTSGVMDISLNSGTHAVIGTFSETPLRLFSDIISLISLLLVIVFFGKLVVFKK